MQCRHLSSSTNSAWVIVCCISSLTYFAWSTQHLHNMSSLSPTRGSSTSMEWRTNSAMSPVYSIHALRNTSHVLLCYRCQHLRLQTCCPVHVTPFLALVVFRALLQLRGSECLWRIPLWPRIVSYGTIEVLNGEPPRTMSNEVVQHCCQLILQCACGVGRSCYSTVRY